MSRIVIALGGNALGKTPGEQLSLLSNVAKIIVELIKDGNEIVLTHGNGPQVGQIALAMEYASNGEAETPSMPFPECGSMSQGYIGYHMQQSILNELDRQGVKKECVSLITQVLVDSNDSAFQNPTKPIGMFYSKEKAMEIEKEKGYVFTEDAGRGYRRVVPSPIPKKIIEKDSITSLLDNGTIVIAVGGGGIPVINSGNGLKGVEAVIDKDRSGALLAREINADIFLILTAVDKVCLNYNTDNEIMLDSLTKEEAEKYIDEGQFAKGSMLPKVEACLDFIGESTSRKAIISSLSKAKEAIDGKTGTVIKRR
ncbi:MAG: carbamate kinase [Bacilli bacterium]|nr:carbamate kinase [Clostridium sp.]MDY2803757.1 carbamate kinase [Bacilli bacterium]